MISNADDENFNFKKFQSDYVVIIKRYFWPLVAAIISLIFGAFNYLAVRRIGKSVHSSVKTMWLGLTSLILCSFFLLFFIPHRLIQVGSKGFWKEQYSLESFSITIVLSCLFYISQECLSIALENIKAGSVATFGYISVLVSHFGYKLYAHIKEMKKAHEHLPGIHLA